MTVSVRPLSSDQHREYIASRPSVSFLQVPEWGAVKSDWGSSSVGWFRGGELVGAGLVLSRFIPRTRKWLAYLPEGPDLPWSDRPETVAELLDPLLAHLRKSGAFLVKIGPSIPVRTWSAATLKSHIGKPGVARLGDVPPDRTNTVGQQVAADLQAQGWTRRPDTGAGFGDFQPRFVFQLPLRDADGSARSPENVFAGFNQLWRRNIRRAEKSGVQVVESDRDGLLLFHPIYVETAARDGFVPRPLSYFQQMWDALNQPESPAGMSLYLAQWEDRVLAATTMITVGDHAWYSYGASANADRQVRPSNAVQWKMMCDALASGATVYDLRGITDTLDESDPHFGLTQFKLGTGGRAVEYVGEYDFALRPTIARAFDAYLRRDQIRARVRDRIGGPFGRSEPTTGAQPGVER
ncbi:MAG: peptidoglycan bridge formation glycyltransferase FemA/FemB family protein [Candidatus Nanopelagicales bacterium]|nr:peptidoglycan bridge formation glycyltransferase FemA/FemB family protein [Candidatus Nanopelagicales bacterium]